MQNFTFYNPVKIYFGQGEIVRLREEIPAHYKILLTYGQGSIKKNGIYDDIKKVLQGYQIIEFGGIESNPRYETLMKAAALCREQKIDMILAVGGGSVIDGSKFIAAATYFQGDPWDIVTKNAPIEKSIPLASVLTLAAAGSEMNCAAVISRESTKEKFGFMQYNAYPKFSILDPTYTFSVPPKDTAAGIADIFIHVLEQYITFPVDAPLNDQFAEGILLTLITEAPKVMANPRNYDARANIMWASSMALNYFICCGSPEDWTAHAIGHELTAEFGIAHGASLSIVWPNVALYKREQKRAKLLRYAEYVWHITSGNEDERIEQGVAKTREFFASLGMKLKLADYGVSLEEINAIVQKLTRRGNIAWGEHQDILIQDVEKILKMCL